MSQILPVSKLSDRKLALTLKEKKINLTVQEAKKIRRTLGRDQTLEEAIIWSIQGSEHSSYKSSKRYLKMLPTDGPNVMLGPSEDAGIVEIAKMNGKKYGLVISHESHNHPSQIVPFEGAATGVGGCVRDVLCMGAKVIAIADSLRFGDIRKKESKFISEGVVEGIGGYGNPIGVPNLAGDTYYHSSYNKNCLVNVVTLGLLAEDEIIHSKAPKGAAEKGYDIIIVGKPTDVSGMGGASFASLSLNKEDRETKKGAVQEPNPFLERVLMESTYDLFRILKEKKMLNDVGFKDLGAGGIMCASVEMVASRGYGANIDLDKVPVSMKNLHPSVIACSETQERMCWIIPPHFTKFVLNHYNEKWALPKIAKGAAAAAIGKVTKGNYILRFNGAVVCNAPSKALTEGLSYNRPSQPRRKAFSEPKIAYPRDLNKVFLELLGHENIASRRLIYETYDKNVQAQTIIEAGLADAGVIAPFLNRDDIPEEFQHIGVALSSDANPRYGAISPYDQAKNAVIEGCRNVAAVGATPWCITDCLNYGNPEKPAEMWEFVEGVKGIRDALFGIGLRGFEKQPLPCVSGNVSFYNASNEEAIAPQAMIATIGRIEDVRKCITPQFKGIGNTIFLVGARKDELGGSAYYDLFGELGANVPQPDPGQARAEIHFILDLIEGGLVLACHDISDGGLGVALAEMCLGGEVSGKIGAKVDISRIEWQTPNQKGKSRRKPPLRSDKKLFSETGGFVLEVKRKSVGKILKIARLYGIPLFKLGFTTEAKKITVFDRGKEILNGKLSHMRRAWGEGLREKL